MVAPWRNHFRWPAGVDHGQEPQQLGEDESAAVNSAFPVVGEKGVGTLSLPPRASTTRYPPDRAQVWL
jgi:hypothetical protein